MTEYLRRMVAIAVDTDRDPEGQPVVVVRVDREGTDPYHLALYQVRHVRDFGNALLDAADQLAEGRLAMGLDPRR